MFSRLLKKLAHRFDWHHAPVHGPMQDGRYQRWCQWCGFRQSYNYDPKHVPQVITKEVAK